MKRKLQAGIAAFGILLTAGSPALAQKTRNLTMDEAIQMSLQHSAQIRMDHAKIDEAIATTREVWNNHLPDLKVSGSYLRVSNPTIDLKVKLGGSSSDTTKKTGGSPKVDQAAYGILNASVPLFSGLRIKYGVESAKFLEQATKLDAEKNKEDVILNTINAYTNLFKAKKSVELVEENLKQQQQRVTDFSNLEKNGLLARNDLLKAQLQQSNIELSLLDAQNNLRLTVINMDLLIGLPEETDLVPDNNIAALPDAGIVINWEQSALQNRKDVASLSFREKAANSSILATKGEYYPSIALTGGYIAADIPNVLTLTNALNIGIGLQYNIGSLWKAGAKIQQAQARLHQIQITEGAISDQVRLEINQAYENYLLAMKKIDVYNKAITQADENYRITKNKYDNSLATTTDLLEADVAQLQSKLNFTVSKADALVAYKKLQQTAGLLSENTKPAK